MATTYQSRPLFDFKVNWGDQPNPSFTYDLRAIRNDWGPLRFAPLQRLLVRGWKFGVLLNSIVDVVAFEAFCDATKGRLNGFWFPAPDNLATVVSGTGTQVIIEDIGLRVTWNTGAPLHVWIHRRGASPQAFAVTAVAAGSPGQEVVTLSVALAAPIDATWRVQRLLYARFAGDEEDWDWIEEGRQHRQITVVELPQEYAAAETGLLKCHFYRFGYNPPGIPNDPLKEWFYTSFQVPISSTYAGTTTSQVHASIPINHGSIKFSSENPMVETTLSDVAYDSDLAGPWIRSRRLGYPPLWVRIFSASYAAPDSTTLLFTGEVQRWKSKGAKLTAPCVGGIDAGNMNLPVSKRGSVCRLHVFGSLCRLSDTAHKAVGTVTAVNGLNLTLTATLFSGQPANWYARGKLETGSGKNLRRSTALRSTAASGISVTLLLKHELGVSVGDTVFVWPGCDGLKATCTTKFNNYPNFDGHPLVPLLNSSIDLLGNHNTSPNKK